MSSALAQLVQHRTPLLVAGIIFATISTAGSPAVHAADLLVAPDGSGPYATIQDAVGLWNPGDTVVLMAGTYTGPGNRNIDSDASCTIRPQNLGDEVVIDLQGSAADPAYGFMVNDGTLTLQALTIRNAYGTAGGAVVVRAGAFVADGCRFLGNTSDRGGAIRCDGGDRVDLHESILAWNTGSAEGGAVYATSFAEIDLSNCTLFMNTSSDGTAVFLEMDATLALDRCIVAYGQGSGYPFGDYYGGPITASNTDIWGNHGGDWVGALAPMLGVDGNISVEPRMCDPMEENFALTAGSPCWVPPATLMGGGNMDLTWWRPVYGLRGDGTGMFATVQDAADAIPWNSAIALETGGYAGPGNTDIGFRGKLIELFSRQPLGAVFAVSYGGGPQSRAFRLHEHEPPGTAIRDILITGARVDTAPLNPGIGAGILVTGDASVTLRNISFSNNFARGGGEAVGIVGPAGEVVIERCSFTTHQYASVIYADGGTLLLDDLWFSQSNAGSLELAAGVVAATLRDVRVDGTEGITATGLGTAPLLFEDCDLALADGFGPTAIVGCDDVTFTGCTLGDGGAVIGEIVRASASTLAFSGCGFTGAGGGAVVALAAANSTLDIRQTTFADLQPGGTRGALDLAAANTAVLEGCEFRRSATGLSAVDAIGLDLTLSGCTFDSLDTAVRIEGAPGDHVAVTGTGFARCGAGLDLLDAPDVTVDGCAFRDGGPGIPLRAENSVLTVANSVFLDAVVADGLGREAGGILGWDSILDIRYCEFRRNTCGGGPGGVQARGGTLLVEFCGLSDNVNQSYDFGGAIYCEATTSAEIVATRLERNTAYDGGAIHVVGADATIGACDILDNAAAHEGGGILMNGGLSYGGSIVGCRVAGNTAQRGGAVWIPEAATVSLYGCTVVGNGGAAGTAQIAASTSVDLFVTYSIIAFGPDGPALAMNDPAQMTLSIACSDLHANAGGDWIGMAAPSAGISGNLDADPWFCDLEGGDFHLASDSPCVADPYGCLTTIGASEAGCAGVSGVEDVPAVTRVALGQNRPNPFNPSTRIAFDLPRETDVTLRIYDLAGRLVRRLLVEERFPYGTHEVTWNGRDERGRAQATGTYLYRLQADGVDQVRKMTLVR